MLGIRDIDLQSFALGEEDLADEVAQADSGARVRLQVIVWRRTIGEPRLGTRENERETIERWKVEGVYPYAAEPEADAVAEQAKRALFNFVAATAAPAIDSSDRPAKRLSLGLLREAVEHPTSLRRIIDNVLDLPETKRSELVELLDRTTLTDMISATRLVTRPPRLAARAGVARLRARAEGAGQGALPTPPDAGSRDLDLRRGVRVDGRR